MDAPAWYFGRGVASRELRLKQRPGPSLTQLEVLTANANCLYPEQQRVSPYDVNYIYAIVCKHQFWVIYSPALAA